MGNFGQEYTPDAQKAFDTFLKMSEKKFPHVKIAESHKHVEAERATLKETYKKFLDKIAEEPLLTFFLIWVKEIAHLRADFLYAAQLLLENDFISDRDANGEPMTVKRTRSIDHRKVLDAIRSRLDWPVRRREAAAQMYIAFMFWLWGDTHGFTNRLEDPDWYRARERKLVFPQFIEFLDALPSEKTQALAKLLYFGGNRTLDEVLSLKISDIDFDTKKVSYGNSAPMDYPGHVFADLKALTDGRKTGLVFLGRQDAPLNDGTVFRHFNEAASKVGLGESFGPKKLVINNEEPSG